MNIGFTNEWTEEWGKTGDKVRTKGLQTWMSSAACPGKHCHGLTENQRTGLAKDCDGCGVELRKIILVYRRVVLRWHV